jgi:anti-sigma regulatory factor (Ser/Thr protein kinase)
MSVRPTGEVIRQYILDMIESHPRDVSRMAREKFRISRQAINRHIQVLIDNESIEAHGHTKDRSYSLKETLVGQDFLLAENHEEHIVWERYIDPVISRFPENVRRICDYGFSEMFNNAIEHSEGTKVTLIVKLTAKEICFIITDDGIGIFEKIKSRFNLNDHRQAILELSKGKLTTDPEKHSGQGIFFTCRMFDRFSMTSSHLAFVHSAKMGDWLIEAQEKDQKGTSVYMTVSTDTKTTTKEVFDRYTDLKSDDYAFSKTHVPLSLAKYGSEQLISRSQARQVLARFDRFLEVLLDFAGVDSIGQAFADEIFRVFARAHPEVHIIAIRTNDQIKQMIARALSPGSEPSSPLNTIIPTK